MAVTECSVRAPSSLRHVNADMYDLGKPGSLGLFNKERYDAGSRVGDGPSGHAGAISENPAGKSPCKLALRFALKPDEVGKIRTVMRVPVGLWSSLHRPVEIQAPGDLVKYGAT